METNLKNYTSSVPADKSVSRIERLLVSIGATNISKQYNDSKLVAISFLVNVNGNTMPFKLPAKVNVVEKVLKRRTLRPKSDGSTWERIAQQAERTAWKIICDWVEIQVSMIKLEQAEVIEIFLPYAYDYKNEKTFFEKLKDGNFAALPQGTA